MTETACRFSEPTLELVNHISRELPYEDRLTAYHTNAATGSQTLICYTMADMVKGLFKTRWNGLLQSGSKASLTWVDMDKLVAWVRDKIGDVELADAMEQAIDKDACYKDQVDALVPVLEERVEQYRQVWEANAPAEESEQ